MVMVKLYLGDKKSITLLCTYRLLFVSITIFLEEMVQDMFIKKCAFLEYFGWP